MTLADRLRTLADALPPAGSVTLTRTDLLELLADTSEPGSPRSATEPVADLTVGEVADLFGRGQSTVRTWISGGLLPGAYRMHGREWRVPRADVEAMQRAQADQHRQLRQQATAPAAGTPADLSSWRRHVRRTG